MGSEPAVADDTVDAAAPQRGSPTSSVLSVDLAARQYKDIGIAVLSGSSRAPQVEFVHPSDLGLKEKPNAEQLADVLIRTASSQGVRLILLDGPQGWKAPDSLDPHMRSCERLTRTPGKTGWPGVVKPSSWTRMATFSIDVFDRLDALGWPRFDTTWNGEALSRDLPYARVALPGTFAIVREEQGR